MAAGMALAGLAVSAAAVVPGFAYFLNVDREMLEAYLVQCEQASGGGLKCKMLDINVSPSFNKAKAAEQRRQADAEAQRMLADTAGLTQMCSVQKQISESLRNRSEPSAVRFRTSYENLCKDKSLAAVKSFVLSMIEHAERTCVIGSGGGWETVFSKKGPNTWVANNGPEGICGRVTIETLEEDPSKPVTWSYTIRKATTTPANDPLCASFPDSSFKYEWSVDERMATCEAIKFGVP
jgi:hypothetical protein